MAETGKDAAGAAGMTDQDSLGITDLARAVLARTIRPRAASVRRLAEAVLAGKAKSKGKKAGKGKDKEKGKRRKLAKIPGQKKGR